jgi:hypothetical protein
MNFASYTKISHNESCVLQNNEIQQKINSLHICRWIQHIQARFRTAPQPDPFLDVKLNAHPYLQLPICYGFGFGVALENAQHILVWR